MKVLIINTIDSGGAANSCKRLHLSLLSENIQSKILLRVKQNDWPASQQFLPKPRKLKVVDKVRNKLYRIAKEFQVYRPSFKNNEQLQFLSDRSRSLELFSFPNSGLDITESPLYKEADIINLHWVANFLDFKSFFKKNTKPVVWTLHDMNPFTGGEHYEERYLGIGKNGRPLERMVTEEEKKMSELNLILKKKALANIKNLYIVAPSSWLAENAKESDLFNSYPIHHITNGLDSKIYKPIDKTFSRRLFNIPENKKVILFVADSLDNHRKGFIYLKKAFEQLPNREDLVLCAIGNSVAEIKNNSGIINLGTIKDERLMSAAYNAADVFVIPSIMDNLPNTVIESLMCGTPVIGFPVGGIPDMVIHEENGLITEEISVAALVRSLKNF